MSHPTTAHPFAGVFPLLDDARLRELADDVRKHGLREPVILYKGQVLDGRNRLRACELAGVSPRFEDFEGDDADALAAVVSLNLHRRHLTESQRAMVAARLLPLHEEDAKKRQGARTDLNIRANLPECSEPTPRPRERVAEVLNVSPRSVQSAKAVVERAAPEVVAAVDAGRVSVGAAVEIASEPVEVQVEIVARGESEIVAAAKAIRERRTAERKAQLAEVKARHVDAPAGLYDVIVLDPPWPMEKIERDVRPNQVAFDYPTMSEAELAAMSLPAGPDCHVWVWTTQRFLPMSLRLLDAWGLRYVCTFVWHKPGGFQPIGLPQYNCEFAIYARRGAPRFIDTKAFPACFSAPRGGHSEKPEEFYDVVRRVTEGRRLDMFNRRCIEGFDVWGKEAGQ